MLSPRKSTAFLLYSGAQFFVLTTIAMFLYPGGAKFFPDSQEYFFLHNFFSDLGATRTYSGKNNLASQILFVFALVSVGLGLIMTAPAWKRVIVKNGHAIQWGSAAELFLTISGLCFIGIAVTPWNLVLTAHNTFVQAAFSLLLGFIFCLTVVQFKNGWATKYIAANISYLAILAVYVFILFQGPRLDTLYSVAFQVAAQKIIVYISIVNLVYQAVGLRRGAGGITANP